MEKIELSQKHQTLRWVAAIFFLVIAVACLGYAFMTLVTPASGWTEIRASAGEEPSCAGEFVLSYELGQGETSVTEEKRELQALYTQAAVDAYQIFDVQAENGPLASLNAHPNEPVTVPEALYRVFAQAAEAGSREFYLGPVYEAYRGIFGCREDWEAAGFDPYQTPDLREYFENVAAYARDPASVELELLGENQVRLRLSPEYLAFLRENEAREILSLGWMKNAFVADYLAQQLADRGYRRGVLSSRDGFARNLDSVSGQDYSLNLFDRGPDSPRMVGTMHYAGPMSLAVLRSFPVVEEDLTRFYIREDGEIRPPYVDIRDGLPKSAVTSLVCYSAQAGCGDLALQAGKFMTGEWPLTQAPALAQAGVETLYLQEGTLWHTQPDLPLSNLSESYSAQQIS